MKDKNLVSITDFTKEQYLRILDIASAFEKNSNPNLLNDHVVG